PMAPLCSGLPAGDMQGQTRGYHPYKTHIKTCSWPRDLHPPASYANIHHFMRKCFHGDVKFHRARRRGVSGTPLRDNKNFFSETQTDPEAHTLLPVTGIRLKYTIWLP